MDDHGGVKVRPRDPRRLKVAQAHRPIFYMPHVVAESIGAFRRRSLDVEVVSMPTSDQWRMLTSGSADIAIGGPMRSMKLLEAGRRIVTFCAAVAGSPWVVVGPSSSRAAGIDDLRGRDVLDDAEIATARLCLRGLLKLGGHAAEDMAVSELPGTELMNRLQGGRFDLALVPLEKVVGLVDSGEMRVLADVGPWTGPIPWSAYQALPEALQQRSQELSAFTEAIGDALQAIREEGIMDLVRLVGDQFPGVAPQALESAIRGYRRMQVWADAPSIPPGDFDRFARILVASGWLSQVPDRALLLTQPA